MKVNIHVYIYHQEVFVCVRGSGEWVATPMIRVPFPVLLCTTSVETRIPRRKLWAITTIQLGTLSVGRG